MGCRRNTSGVESGRMWKKYIRCGWWEDHGRNIRVKSGGAVEETPQCGRWEDWKKHFSV